MNSLIKLTIILCCALLLSNASFCQTSLSGNVTDDESGESLIGANILVENTSTGTITDIDGNYELTVDQEPPFNLIISLVGYDSQSITVSKSGQTNIIQLLTGSILADEVVVSASRVEENILQSPVTVEILNLKSIKSSAAPDFYDEINNLKGVTRTQASLTFNTINTRGFATAGNTRFVQLQDGIDNSAPLLNFPTGNIVGISELDIKNVELVPGAASALYGPNAFNGILFMNSKDPWNYEGLSAQLKTGVTDGQEVNPLYGFSARWADKVNDKFAYKLNVSTFFAQDWEASNFTGHLSSVKCPDALPGETCFNGSNVYGDETLIPLNEGEAYIARTGYTEAELIDNNNAESIKLDAALHYKISDNVETNVSFKHGTGSTVYQGAERYALRDFVQQFAKWELNGDKWNIRAYGSFTDDGDSYNLSALGAFVNEGRWTSLFTDDVFGLQAGWAVAANVAYSGSLAPFGVAGGDADVAKNFADNGGLNFFNNPAVVQAFAEGFAANFGVPLETGLQLAENISGPSRLDPSSSEFQALVNQVRTGLFQRGGAGFIDNSSLYHAEGNYDLSSMINDVIGLQIGANVRQYSLFTDGTIFREFDESTGQNERIKINEFGGYLQASKTIVDALKITGSIRYDKNQNFKGQVSPRLSAVYSIDKKKRHNIRASWQTGFRNPTTQGQYIFFPASQLLLGGTKENADIINEIDGSVFNIFEDGALALDGTEINLDYVQPERLTAFEVGYKGIFNGKLYVDLNYYRNSYENFINQLSVFSTVDLQYQGNFYEAGSRQWFPYTNVPEEATFSSQGIDFGFRYRLNRTYSLQGNYSNATVDFDETKLIGTAFEGSGFDPGFNTPENKFTIGLVGTNIISNLSFNANYRYQDEFFYSSSFGNGTVPSNSVVDVSLGYFVPSMNTNFKLGITNLLKEEYITNIGNPLIGRTLVLTVTYDQFAN